MKNLGLFALAVIPTAIFWATMLAINPSCGFLELTISSTVFIIAIFFSMKRKSILIAIAGTIFSTILFYMVWGIHALVNFTFEMLAIPITYLIELAKIPMNYFIEIGHEEASYVIIGVLALIVFLIIIRILKKVWQKIKNIIKKVIDLYNDMIIIVPNDEAHVITRKDGSITVYSGRTVFHQDAQKNYGGNHYLNWNKIKFLKFIFVMIIAIIEIDDTEMTVKNIDNIGCLGIKDEDGNIGAGLVNIGLAGFNYRVNHPEKASLEFAGKGMSHVAFQKAILPIVREAVAVTVAKYTVTDLATGNIIVNEGFRDRLKEKLENRYGIEVTSGQLSEEGGDLIEEYRNIEKHRITGKAGAAEQKSLEVVQVATESKQKAANKVLVTTANGIKKAALVKANQDAEIVKITAAAEYERIVKEGGAKAKALLELLKAQSKHKDVFTIGILEKIVAADASRFPQLTTMFGGGEKGMNQIAEIIALVKTMSGIDITGNETSEKAAA